MIGRIHFDPPATRQIILGMVPIGDSVLDSTAAWLDTVVSIARYTLEYHIS